MMADIRVDVNYPTFAVGLNLQFSMHAQLDG